MNTKKRATESRRKVEWRIHPGSHPNQGRKRERKKRERKKRRRKRSKERGEGEEEEARAETEAEIKKCNIGKSETNELMA